MFSINIANEIYVVDGVNVVEKRHVILNIQLVVFHAVEVVNIVYFQVFHAVNVVETRHIL